MRHTLIAGAISAALLTWAPGASAAPPHLKGRYAVTGTGACLVAPPGFNANLTPKSDTNGVFHFFSNSNSVLAVRTYNGDGTGKAEGSQVRITPPPTVGMPFGPSASSSTFSFSFTYSVNANGILTTDMVPGTFLGTILAGPRTGQTFTVDKLSFMGLVSGDKKVLDVATVTPEVATVTYSNGDVWQEICHRSRVHTFLGQRSDD